MPPMNDMFSSSKTTEVVVTSESRANASFDLAPLGRGIRRHSEVTDTPQPPSAAYSVVIQSGRTSAVEPNGDALVPIKTNSTVPVTPGPRTGPLKKKAAYEANNATWSYTKCAILFFTAMLVTWIPSSANRVYSVVHDNNSSMALEYMSAFVLPLQGFWNAIIYMVTSWKACQMFFGGMFWSGRSDTKEPMARTFPMMTGGRSAFRGLDKTYESESMTDLAGSRPSTHDHPSLESPRSKV